MEALLLGEGEGCLYVLPTMVDNWARCRTGCFDSSNPLEGA